jgi:hypothetical protein
LQNINLDKVWYSGFNEKCQYKVANLQNILQNSSELVSDRFKKFWMNHFKERMDVNEEKIV